MRLRTQEPRAQCSAQRDDDQLSLLDNTAGLDKAEQNTDPWWGDIALRAVKAMAATGQLFEAFDLTKEPYALREPAHPNHWGALLRQAAQLGLIEPVGFAPSRRPSRAGGVSRQWRGAVQQ